MRTAAGVVSYPVERNQPYVWTPDVFGPPSAVLVALAVLNVPGSLFGWWPLGVAWAVNGMVVGSLVISVVEFTRARRAAYSCPR